MTTTLVDAVSFVAASAGTGAFVQATTRSSYLTIAQAIALGEMVDGQTVSYSAQDSLTSPTQREWGHGTVNAGANSIARTTVIGTVNNGAAGSGSPLNFSVAPTILLTILAEDLTGRTVLTGNTTYYIRTTGNDTTGDGSLAKPWLTLQHAMQYIASNVDIGGFVVTVNIGAGTFVGVSVLSCVGGGSISWLGAGAGTTFLTGINFDSCIEVLQDSGGTQHFVSGLTLNAQSGFWGVVVQAPIGLLFGRDAFFSAHPIAINADSNPTLFFVQEPNAVVTVHDDFTLNNIGGNIGSMGRVEKQAQLNFNGNTITVTGNNINWTNAGFIADTDSFLQQEMQFAGLTAATGKKFTVKGTSLMNTFDQVDTPCFIGSVEGTVTAGGVVT